MRKDFYWLNKDSVEFLNRGYLGEGVSPKDRIRQIGDAIEARMGFKGYSDKYYEYMSKGWISMSSPIWSNFGLPKRGLGISCFGGILADTTVDILRGLGEVGIMSKYGGGTSVNMSNIRPRGSVISGGGISNGIMPFIEMYQSVTDTISQNGVRRGNVAIYLDIDHGDIEEFLTIRDENSPIQNVSIAVNVTDKFMEEMIAGDSYKRQVWGKILKKREETGFPYLNFTDTDNKNKPQVYKDKGLHISSSNLCITGDTRIVTNKGYLTAKELHEKGGKLTLFDGDKAVEASEMMLRGEMEDVYAVELENGMVLKSTDYHGYPVIDERGIITKTELKNLVVGDFIATQVNKGLFGDEDRADEAFLLGLYQGDGTQSKEQILIDLWEDDFDLLEEVYEIVDNMYKRYGWNTYKTSNQFGEKGYRETPIFSEQTVREGSKRKMRLGSSPLKRYGFEKGVIPDWIWEANEKTQWAYVKGLLYTDGTVFVSKSAGNPIQLNYASIRLGHIQELQKLFTNLGLSTSIRLAREAGKSLLPDGKGGEKYYDTKDCYRLIVSNKPDCLKIEKNTGFLSRKGIEVEDREYRNNTKKRYKVKSITYVGKEDVYCPTVYSDEHIFVANGMKTFNCNEIKLSTSELESFVCCISSVNVEHFDEWKNDKEFIWHVMVMLEAVMQEFIEKAQHIPYFEKAVTFAKNQNAVGLGVLGLHSYLQKNMIPFEGIQSKGKINEIFSHLDKMTLEASKDLAIKLGEPPLLKGYGERFTTRMAVAPTTSSSFILGQVSPSIEPLMSNYFLKDIAKGRFSYKNPYLEKVLEDKGKNNFDVWESIMKEGGSVQHLTFLSDLEKDVFKTFEEISQLDVVQNASIMQRYVDQGISLNIMIHPDVPVREINQLIIEGWKLGLKGFYYNRSANKAQELGRSLVSCSSCES